MFWMGDYTYVFLNASENFYVSGNLSYMRHHVCWGMKGAVFVSPDINYEMKIIMQKYLSESVCGIVLR